MNKHGVEDAGGYRARVRSLASGQGEEVPVYGLMVSEIRGNGWSAALELRPNTADPGRALAETIDAGLAPGTACAVRLTRTGALAREWAGTVVSVAAKAPGVGEDYAHCTIGMTDPVTALATRTIEFGWGECDLAALLGAAVSAAGNGRGRLERAPALPGAPALRFDAEVRGTAKRLRYAIAAGESLGEWLEKLCAKTATRVELESTGPGEVRVVARDAPPRESGLNRKGPITLAVRARGMPAPGEMVVDTSMLESAARERGGILDNAELGDAAPLGPAGPIETVFDHPGWGREDGEADRRRRLERDAAAQVGLGALSCAPAMTPGRTVAVRGGGAEGEASPGERTVFGATQWQVAGVAHLYEGGHYVNRASLEKAAAAWHPSDAEPAHARVRTATVHTLRTEQGEEVHADRLGRVPVRLGAMTALAGDPDQEAHMSIPLPVRAESAGARHGAHGARQHGDVCRVAVHHPLRAEVIGFVHRDDRAIKEAVRSASQAQVMHQNEEGWTGAAFGSVRSEGAT